METLNRRDQDAYVQAVYYRNNLIITGRDTPEEARLLYIISEGLKSLGLHVTSMHSHKDIELISSSTDAIVLYSTYHFSNNELALISSTCQRVKTCSDPFGNVQIIVINLYVSNLISRMNDINDISFYHQSRHVFF